MKRYKNTILSTLLLAFMLSVVHDYAFLNASAQFAKNEHAIATEAMLNVTDDASDERLKLQLHHGFHVLLETPMKLHHTADVVKQYEAPFYNQKTLLSREHPVLLRPPVV